MIDTVSADADRVSDYAGNRLQSVIDRPGLQGGEGQCPLPRAAGRVAPRRIAVSLAMSSFRGREIRARRRQGRAAADRAVS